MRVPSDHRKVAVQVILSRRIEKCQQRAVSRIPIRNWKIEKNGKAFSNQQILTSLQRSGLVTRSTAENFRQFSRFKNGEKSGKFVSQK